MSGEESKREKESGASNDQSNEKGKGGERESRHKNGHEISGGALQGRHHLAFARILSHARAFSVRILPAFCRVAPFHYGM